MPNKEYRFYRDGKLVYTCYTLREKRDYESDLIQRGVEYELKIEDIFK